VRTWYLRTRRTTRIYGIEIANRCAMIHEVQIEPLTGKRPVRIAKRFKLNGFS
jgi:hypothetical protein